jgi:SnoaL-like domain
MTTQEIAKVVVDNCRSGNMLDNYELYDENAVKYEPVDSSVERETKGKHAILNSAKHFHSMIEKLVSRVVSQPLIAGNYFAFSLCQEFQLKGVGYYKLDEICLLRVQDGKIIYEEYFYSSR